MKKNHKTFSQNIAILLSEVETLTCGALILTVFVYISVCYIQEHIPIGKITVTH